MSDMAMSTRIVYTVEGEHVPYRVNAATEAHKLTLALFKTITQRFHFRFFFLSFDPEYGTLKEEVTDEDAVCPSSHGLVQAWLTPLNLSDDTTKLSPLTCTSNNMTGLSGNTGTSSDSRVIYGCSSSHSSAYQKSTSVSCGESFLHQGRVAGGFMTSSPSSWVNAEEQRCRSAEMYREYERQMVSREVLSDTCAEIMARGHWNYGSVYERGDVDSVVADTQQNASAIPKVADSAVAVLVPGNYGQDKSKTNRCDDPANNLIQGGLQESGDLADNLQLDASALCIEDQLQEHEHVAKETKLSDQLTFEEDCLKSDKLYPDMPKHIKVLKTKSLDLSSKWKSLSLHRTTKPFNVKGNTLPKSTTDLNQKKSPVLKNQRTTSQLRDENRNKLYPWSHEIWNPVYQPVSGPCSFCENVGSVYQSLTLRPDQLHESVSTTDIFSVSPLSHSLKQEDSFCKDQEVYNECTYGGSLEKGDSSEVNLFKEVDTSCLEILPPAISLKQSNQLQATSPTTKGLPHHPHSTHPEHIHSLTQLPEPGGTQMEVMQDTESRIRTLGLSVPPELETSDGCLQEDLQQILTDLHRPSSYMPEIKDREWLGCTIPNAVVGIELISWLRNTKNGLRTYQAARKYAQKMLDDGVIIAFLSSETSFIDEWYYTVV